MEGHPQKEKKPQNPNNGKKAKEREAKKEIHHDGDSHHEPYQ